MYGMCVDSISPPSQHGRTPPRTGDHDQDERHRDGNTKLRATAFRNDRHGSSLLSLGLRFEINTRMAYDAEGETVQIVSDKADGPTASTRTFAVLDSLATLLAHVPHKGEVYVRYCGACSVRRRAAWREAGALAAALGGTPAPSLGRGCRIVAEMWRTDDNPRLHAGSGRDGGLTRRFPCLRDPGGGVCRVPIVPSTSGDSISTGSGCRLTETPARRHLDPSTDRRGWSRPANRGLRSCRVSPNGRRRTITARSGLLPGLSDRQRSQEPPPSPYRELGRPRPSPRQMGGTSPISDTAP